MTTPAISIQLWTVRDELTADLDGTLAKLSSIGFTNVEAFGFVSRADELAAAFARHGISSPTGHASLASGTENPFDASIAVPTPDEVFTAANKLGMTTVFDPFVAPDRWESVEEIAKTAEALNAAAVDWCRLMASRSATTTTIRSSTTRSTAASPSRSSPICSTRASRSSSTSTGPRQAARMSSRCSSASATRVTALHVKDGTLEPLPSLGAIPTDQVPAGEGVVALSAALDAAKSAEYAIVEFDAYPGDIWQGVQTGYEFLTARGLA